MSSEESGAGEATVGDGRFEPTIDPFARHRGFSRAVRGGQIRTIEQRFAERWREPIDTQADRRMDLEQFGKAPESFVKPPRPKKPHEFPEGLDERVKKDLERQFILRNLMRYVKEVDPDERLEYDRQTIGLEAALQAREEMPRYVAPQLLPSFGYDAARDELRWRHTMLRTMRWERHFCREIREDWTGPMWKYDPDAPKEEVEGDG